MKVTTHSHIEDVISDNNFILIDLDTTDKWIGSTFVNIGKAKTISDLSIQLLEVQEKLLSNNRAIFKKYPDTFYTVNTVKQSYKEYEEMIVKKKFKPQKNNERKVIELLRANKREIRRYEKQLILCDKNPYNNPMKEGLEKLALYCSNIVLGKDAPVTSQLAAVATYFSILDDQIGVWTYDDQIIDILKMMNSLLVFGEKPNLAEPRIYITSIGEADADTQQKHGIPPGKKIFLFNEHTKYIQSVPNGFDSIKHLGNVRQYLNQINTKPEKQQFMFTDKPSSLSKKGIEKFINKKLKLHAKMAKLV